MSFLDKCEEFFGSKDFYEILNVPRNATDKQIKKAYHKLSLLVHPDRVEDNKKLLSTEKFKVLGKIHSVLQDESKRQLYDDCGEFDADDGESNSNWMEYWRNLFKPITTQDIRKFEQDYIGSETELRDVKRAYVNGKGCMNYMLENVPFLNCEGEPRIMEIVRRMVDAGEVEEFDGFFNEPKKKTMKRKRLYQKEKRDAEKMAVNDDELANEILQRQKQRENSFINLIEKLEKQAKDPVKRKSIKYTSSPSSKRQTRQSKK